MDSPWRDEERRGWDSVETGAQVRDDVALAPPLVALEVAAPHRFARVLPYDATKKDWAEAPPPPTAFEASLRTERGDVAGVPLSLALPPGETTRGVALYARGAGVDVSRRSRTAGGCPPLETTRRRSAAVLRSRRREGDRRYGAYGARLPRALDGERAALLKWGHAVALGGIRGGGELGPAWHAAGRASRKAASAADVESCAELLKERFGAVVARGRSAGGLSVGGALCRRPELFSAVALDVPFLDPLFTLQDAALPLTVNEWEEFGNPHEGGAREAIAEYAIAASVRGDF